jgi:hypothetical protein
VAYESLPRMIARLNFSALGYRACLKVPRHYILAPVYTIGLVYAVSKYDRFIDKLIIPATGGRRSGPASCGIINCGTSTR